MKPRWLAFALTLPTDDVLFVQYTVPTIVMSRQCDQHNKACAGHPDSPCMPGSRKGTSLAGGCSACGHE
jgi:hypothetical protein